MTKLVYLLIATIGSRMWSAEGASLTPWRTGWARLGIFAVWELGFPFFFQKLGELLDFKGRLPPLFLLVQDLEDTLGFTPKVDFNAGVVAAGEAQIESTVTGNAPETFIPDAAVALRLG